MTSGAASARDRLAAPAGNAAAPETPLHVQAIPERTHLEHLLRQVYGNLNAGRTDVAVTNLCHALRVACAACELSQSEAVLLRLIDRDHGGIL